eukprot:scaffold286002_cov45-Prasinocladus_malaysianus.AAC.1
MCAFPSPAASPSYSLCVPMSACFELHALLKPLACSISVTSRLNCSASSTGRIVSEETPPPQHRCVLVSCHDKV